MAGKSISIRTRARRRQEGFTLIETLISMVVMTVGLVALLGVFGLAMASTQTSQENAIGKRLANEALEGILTARETANITWGELQNTGSGGIFLAGAQPINNPGVDGIIGTADDAAAGAQRLEMPGPSGVYAGTCPPDNCMNLSNYTRTIAIQQATNGGVPIPTLNIVTITITYTTPQLKIPKNYVLVAHVSQYR
ncbi:MAG: prepilin-type N-terminal cleavage/methylation domain-containing protein [Acidobacteriia bacterium]|nr:prepilin-type N-terminal cleavage/methylation domain-containing protein [Terriglobia bacterium]